jgi:hypothetical protein
MARIIRLTSCLTDAAAAALKAKFLDWRHYDTLLAGEDVDVYKPDGTPLLLLRHRALKEEVCRRAYPALRHAARPTQNRGVAAGGGRSPRRKRDGSQSKTAYAPGVESGIIGYFDRTAREPYCRTTAFTWEEVHEWRAAQPFIAAVNGVFAQAMPARHAAQMRAVRATRPEWVIGGTAFTTVTVNRNYRSATHKDKGDLPAGFGVLSVLRAGEYEGGHLVFPQYRVAVDLHPRDVLMADVHEWHGNTALVGEEGRYERISCVFYYRTNMRHCLSPSQERERAKRRRRGDPLN